MTELDERLIIAMRVARKHRLSYWFNELQEHRRHDTFEPKTSPMTREYGFTCSCSGREIEWAIDVAHLRELLPENRRILQNLMLRRDRRGKQKSTRADKKARAILHSCLTKEQRWSLRATKSFEVRGSDGRMYLVRLGHGVALQFGCREYSLCVVTKKEPLPAFDLMLAHKLMLESDAETFIRTACVTEKETGWHSKDGSFLLDEANIFEPLPPAEPRLNRGVLPLPDDTLDDPLPWVQGVLGE